jgi:hypothetical protein
MPISTNNGGEFIKSNLILPLKPMAINTHAVKATQKGEEVMTLKTQRDKFQRYLTLLFHDLCAKTNGLTKKEIDEYTFMKVMNLNLLSYFSIPSYLVS